MSEYFSAIDRTQATAPDSLYSHSASLVNFANYTSLCIVSKLSTAPQTYL